MAIRRQLEGQRVVVVGAGGHGKSVATILLDMGATVVGFLDDRAALDGACIMGLPVLGDHSKIGELDIDGAIVGIGDNAARCRIFTQLTCWGIVMVNAIHPTAYIAPSAKLGQGVVVEQYGVIDTESVVGDNTIVGMHTMVAHDVQIGNHCHIAPGSRICGEAKVQEGAFVAVNASVLPTKTVGAWSTVGANAVVNKDLPPYVTAVGVPARVILPHQQEKHGDSYRPKHRRIAVIGAGGHARSVANILHDMGHQVVALLDDDPCLHNTSFAGRSVLGPPALVQDLDLDGAIVAIGDNAVRKRLFEQLLLWDIPLINAIHPSAYIASDVTLGRGVVVMPLAAVNTGATIGDNVIISLHTVISHECVVGAHSHIAVNACLCGRVTVQEGVFVGAGATIIPVKQIGAWTMIGAGATVLQDLPANVVAVGVPARILRQS